MTSGQSQKCYFQQDTTPSFGVDGHDAHPALNFENYTYKQEPMDNNLSISTQTL